jgi:hypothetical protein
MSKRTYTPEQRAFFSECGRRARGIPKVCSPEAIEKKKKWISIVNDTRRARFAAKKK